MRNLNSTILKRLAICAFLLLILGITGAMAKSLKMDKFRWRNDDGTELNATWKADTNIPISNVDQGQNIRLRCAMYNSDPESDYTVELYYSTEQDNSLNFTRLLDADELVPFVMSSTDFFCNDDTTTRQLCNDTVPYGTGYCMEYPMYTKIVTYLETGYNEMEFCIMATEDAIPGQTYYFRAYNTFFEDGIEPSLTIKTSSGPPDEHGNPVPDSTGEQLIITHMGITIDSLEVDYLGAMNFDRWDSSPPSSADTEMLGIAFSNDSSIINIEDVHDKYWSLSRGSMRYNFYFNLTLPTDGISGISDINKLVIVSRDNEASTWNPHKTTVVDGTFLRAENFSTFGQFAIASGTELTRLLVTNNLDSGPGSFRQVITDANDGDSILFAVPNENIRIYSTLEIEDKGLFINGGNRLGTGNRVEIYPVVQGFRAMEFAAAGFTSTMTNIRVAAGRIEGLSGQDSYGGGVYVHPGCTVNFNNVEFVSPGSLNASRGGFLAADSGSVVHIDDCRFADGVGINDGLGGQVYLNKCKATIERSTFYNAYTEPTSDTVGGGAMAILSSTVTMTNCTFSDNQSQKVGGAIYISTVDTTPFNVSLVNNTFCFNSCGESYSDGGGALYVSSPAGSTSQLSLLNNLLADNKTYSSKSNTDFFHDTVNLCTLIDLGNNLVEYPNTGAGAGGFTNGVNNCIVGDQTYLNIEWSLKTNNTLYNTNTLAIHYNSVAFGAGQDTGAPLFDQRGITRYGIKDIGAYEWDFPVYQSTNVVEETYANCIFLGWLPGSGSKRVVFMKEGATGVTPPKDSTTYIADTIFGNGSSLGTGWHCIYNGDSDSTIVGGLNRYTQYRFQVFEYDGDPGCEIYNKMPTEYSNPRNILTNNNLFVPDSTVYHKDTLWNYDTVYVMGELRIECGATLNIEPGSVIYMNDGQDPEDYTFGEDSTINVGFINSMGNILAPGTADQKITFSSAEFGGYWGAIILHACNTDQSIFRNCEITGASHISGLYPPYDQVNHYGALSIESNNVIIDSCRIAANKHFSVDLLRNASNNQISNSIFEGNAGPGISIHDSASYNTIRNSTFNGMTAAVSIMDNSSNNLIENCNIEYSVQGVRIDDHCNSNRIINNLISFHTDQGIYLTDSCTSTYIINNTIVNNSTYGVQIDSCAIGVIVENNIIRDNSSGALAIDSTASAQVNYNCLDGDSTGTGNLYLDPQFTDPGNLDFSLSILSHCINSGNPDTTGLNLPVLDLADETRIYYYTVDMGAYEYQKVQVYAGSDSTINDQTETFNLSEAIASDSLPIAWSTDGDGTFDTLNILHPIYTLGANDLLSDSVILILTGNPIDPQFDAESDSLILKIVHYPVVEIISPADSSGACESVITVSGTTIDLDGNLLKTEIRIKDSAWNSTTGVDNWSANMTLSPGGNIIQVRGTDGTSFESEIVEITVFFTGQQIPIVAGWSVISSALNPVDTLITDVMQDVDGLVLMFGANGLYAPPPFGINTIINWDVYSGYRLKMTEADTLNICGPPVENFVEYPAGSYLIPVLTNVEAPIDSIFEDPENDVAYICDIYTGEVYWPNGGISTLTKLLPGVGYMAGFANTLTIEFPDYEYNAKGIHNRENYYATGPWECARSGNIHLISIKRSALEGLGAGFFGAFDQDGMCIGFTTTESKSGNIPLIVFGDDEWSSEKDGAFNGENIRYRFYSTSSQKEFEMTAIYNLYMPNWDGTFSNGGMSMIESLYKSSSSGVNNFSEQIIHIYPNPAEEFIMIDVISDSQSGFVGDLKITNINGETVLLKTISNLRTKIDVQNFTAGVYILQIITSTNTTTKRIIIR